MKKLMRLFGWTLLVANAASFVFINGATDFVLFGNLMHGHYMTSIASWAYCILSIFITSLAAGIIYNGREEEVPWELEQGQGPDITVNVIGKQHDI